MAARQGDLLGMLQKSARNGTLLSSCEPEVRELMHQIDVLISGKQAQWAGQWAGLETQLREKEKELSAVKCTLWQKDSELSQVSDKYEQLKARRQHKHSSIQGVSARKTSEEILQLRQDKQVLEEVRAQLEGDKAVLEEQLHLTKLEATALQEKCAALEGEVKFCRSQLDQKDSLVAAIEQSSSVRTKQLQAQLKRAQELAESTGLALQRVRGECEERRREAETACAEVLSLNSQLTHSQASVRQLRGKYAELQGQVQKLEDQLKVTGSQLSMKEHSMKLMQDSSQRKDKLIKSLGGKQVQGSELNRLKQELGHAHSQLQAQSQRERELLEEVACLKQRRAGDRQEMARLTAQCASQEQRLAQELATLTQQHSTELNELRSQLLKMAREKSLALEQMEAECEARLEKQQKLLEERLRAGSSRPTASEPRPASARVTKNKAPPTHPPTKHNPTPPSHPPTKHNPAPPIHPPTKHNPAPPTPITVPTTGSYPLSHATLPQSAIIGKFLQETEKLTRQNPPLLEPPLKATSSTPGLQFQYHSQEEIVSGSLPFPLSASGGGASGGYVPLQPISHTEGDGGMHPAPSTKDRPLSSSKRAEGYRDREGGGGMAMLEREGGSSEPRELEDMYSKTLDSIVDRHFQQLDSSLKKLMISDS